MNAPVLVTGGTGTLGRLVVPRLRVAGCDVRILSRHPSPTGTAVEHVTGDLASGEGVAAAMDGVETVVHLAGSAKGDGAKARSLVQAASGAGVRHLVFISVVGADRVPVGYFRAKQAAEQIIAESGVPWTTLRATQFHELILKVCEGLTRLPIVPVPGVRFQPVEAGEVADRLVELILARPAGLVGDVAGPQVARLRDLVETYLRIRGKHRPLVPVHVPGRAGRAFRAGANLASTAERRGRTWEEFLRDRQPAGATSMST